MSFLYRIPLLIALIWSTTGCLNEAAEKAGSEKVSSTDTSIGVERFKQLAPMPENRIAHTADFVNSKMYVIGGVHMQTAWTAVYPTEVIEYDPAVDGWMVKGHMSFGRYGHASAVYNNQIYIFGGYKNGITDLNSVEAYDPATDSWSTKANMPEAAGYVSAATIGSLIYVFIRAQNGAGGLAKGFVYNPATDSWGTISSDLSLSIGGNSFVSAGTKVYFVGRGSLITYDAQTDSWSSVGGISAGFSSNWSKAAYINDVIYSFEASFIFTNSLGYLEGSNEMEIYFPLTNSSSRGTYMPFSLTMTGVAQDGGKVYISGGAVVNYQGEVTRGLYVFEP